MMFFLMFNVLFYIGVGLTKLAHWYNRVEKLNLEFFKRGQSENQVGNMVANDIVIFLG